MRIAVLVAPWVKLPPEGYGGIEAMIAVQLPELVRLGHDVTVFTVGTSELPAGVTKRWFFAEGLYSQMNGDGKLASAGAATAHLLYALNAIRDDGGFDIIHCHLGTSVLLALTHASADLPPVLHTFHNPLLREDLGYGVDAIELGARGARRVFFNGVSLSQLANTTASLSDALESKTLGVVHNPVVCDDGPLQPKSDYFTMMARIVRSKGQDLAVQWCRKLGVPLILAGPIDDQAFFDAHIRPYLGGGVEYVGIVSGQAKQDLLACAKGFLSPHRGFEAFGLAPLEANALGTGVVAMALGGPAETIVHGHNGYLAPEGDDAAFCHWMTQIDQIDPEACRAFVRERFTPLAVATQYVALYEEVLRRVR